MSVFALIFIEVGDRLRVEEFVKETTPPPPRASVSDSNDAP